MKSNHFLALFFLLSQIAIGQPEKQLSTEFWAAVKVKEGTKVSNSDWPVYADKELTVVVGRLSPGRSVRVTGSASGSLLFIFDDKLSGYITYKALALNGQYWIGMSEAAAKYSLGTPDKINASSSGLDQWIYEMRELYLYFSKGFLVSTQSVRK